jgi:hypothetical protein
MSRNILKFWLKTGKEQSRPLKSPLPHPQPFSLIRRRVLEERVEVPPAGKGTLRGRKN